MNPGRGLFSVAKLDSIVKINPRQTFLAEEPAGRYCAIQEFMRAIRLGPMPQLPTLPSPQRPQHSRRYSQIPGCSGSVWLTMPRGLSPARRPILASSKLPLFRWDQVPVSLARPIDTTRIAKADHPRFDG